MFNFGGQFNASYTWLHGSHAGKLAFVQPPVGGVAKSHIVNGEGGLVAGAQWVSAYRLGQQIIGGEARFALRAPGLSVGMFTAIAESRSGVSDGVAFKIGDGHPLEWALAKFINIWERAPASMAMFASPVDRGTMWALSRPAHTADADWETLAAARSQARQFAGYAPAPYLPDMAEAYVCRPEEDTWVSPIESGVLDQRARLFAHGARIGYAHVLRSAGHAPRALFDRYQRQRQSQRTQIEICPTARGLRDMLGPGDWSSFFDPRVSV